MDKGLCLVLFGALVYTALLGASFVSVTNLAAVGMQAPSAFTNAEVNAEWRRALPIFVATSIFTTILMVARCYEMWNESVPRNKTV